MVMRLLPVRSPMGAPARWLVVPAAMVEVRRGVMVVTHGYPEHVRGHVHGIDVAPRAVVPGARVPPVVVEIPEEAVVEEVVRVHGGRPVDVQALPRLHLRVCGKVHVGVEILLRGDRAGEYAGAEGEEGKEPAQGVFHGVSLWPTAEARVPLTLVRMAHQQKGPGRPGPSDRFRRWITARGYGWRRDPSGPASLRTRPS